MPLRVKYFPYQPHCFAFGGFDMQMLNAMDAVNAAGGDASKFDLWSRDSDFDIMHLWGIGPHNFTLIDWCVRANKKIVATVLLPYFEGFKSKLSYLKNFGFYRNQIKYFNLLDIVFVVNLEQKRILTQYFKVRSDKIIVIPNIVKEHFFTTPTTDFSKKWNIKDYVLCTGNICRRKNQLNLTRACIDKQLKLVLIGGILEGEQNYAAELRKLIQGREDILWLEALEEGTDELVSAYFYCSLFALPSYDETQPISALEAVAMRKKIVLNNLGYAHQEFYKNAVLSNSGRSLDIGNALVKAAKLNNHPHNPKILTCTKSAVGSSYYAAYYNLARV